MKEVFSWLHQKVLGSNDLYAAPDWFLSDATQDPVPNMNPS
jgi:hypothetical protein